MFRPTAGLALLLLASCATVTHEEDVRDRHGRPLALVHRRDGAKDGPVTTFWPNGGIRAQGMYRTDHKEGWWWTFHPNGTKAGLAHYTNGSKNGPRIYWDSLGRPVRAEVFAMGIPDGPFMRYHPDGRPAQRSTYVNGSLEGPHDQWYLERGGSYVNGFYHHGRKAGIWTEYAPDGRIIGQAYYKRGILIRTLRGRLRKH